jgi:hypothetical protein
LNKNDVIKCFVNAAFFYSVFSFLFLLYKNTNTEYLAEKASKEIQVHRTYYVEEDIRHCKQTKYRKEFKEGFFLGEYNNKVILCKGDVL